jgi:phage baseplate assembly protein W
MITPAIALPFTIDTYGRVAKAADENKVWADRVLSVIGTGKLTRVYRPEFGSLIDTSFFDVLDSASVIITDSIKQAFYDFLPLLQLDSVELIEDTEQGVLTASISYILPDNTQEQLTVGLAYVSNTDPIYEDI